MSLLLILFLVATLIIMNRGLFATDTIFTVGLIVWHIPLILLVQFPDVLGQQLTLIAAQYRLSHFEDIVLLSCITAPLGFWLGGVFRRRLKARFKPQYRAVPRKWTYKKEYAYLFIFFGVTAFSINALSYIRRGSGSYAQSIGSGSAAIHPVVDWFLVYCFLVFLFVFIARLPERIRPLPFWKIMVLFLPLFPLFLSGSRQAFLGPVLAFLIIKLPLQQRDRPMVYACFLLLVSALPFLSNALRMSRITADEVVQWANTDGYVGFLFELGRTVRLVGWASETCARITPDPVGYLGEALGRLTFLDSNAETLSVTVTGGGNGFSFVAEAICVVGPSAAVYWSLAYGFVLGLLFSVCLDEKSDVRDRFLFAFYLAVAIMWPRDELLGYAREMVWFGLIPLLLFFRSTRVIGRWHSAKIRAGQ